MEKIGINSEIVEPAKNRVTKTLGWVTGALAEKGVGNRAVRVVNYTYGRAYGRRHNVSRHGDCAITVAVDILAADIFRKLPSAGGCHGGGGDGSPLAECIGDQCVPLRSGDCRTEWALVGVVVDRPLRPRERRAGRPLVEVADSGDVARTAGSRNLHEREQQQNYSYPRIENLRSKHDSW